VLRASLLADARILPQAR